MASLLSAPLSAEDAPPEPLWDASTIYAIIDSNEWCSGGSIHIDLWSGNYILMPRPLRRQCMEVEARARPIETGMLAGELLGQIRVLNRQIVETGLEREECPPMISNGGPEVLTLVGPYWSMISTKTSRCLSQPARALHRLLYDEFGQQAEALPADQLENYRVIDE